MSPGGQLRWARDRRDTNLWPNPGLFASFPEPVMANKIRTEADARATPRPPAPLGVTVTLRKGQKSSLERGAHTRSKKNPGKRPRKGG